MREIDPDSRDWNEYLSAALMAQFVAIPQPMKPDNELIPGRDDLESEE